MTIKKRKKNYVNNADLVEALVAYIAEYKDAELQGKKLPQIPDYIGVSIMQIATRLASRPNFSGYMYKEDMIMDGVENCLKYITNFNPEKTTNAFAYITQIIWYAFLRRIHREKKELYVKYKSGQNLLHGGQDTSEVQVYLTDKSDFVNAFIEDYEEKNLKKNDRPKI